MLDSFVLIVYAKKNRRMLDGTNKDDVFITWIELNFKNRRFERPSDLALPC